MRKYVSLIAWRASHQFLLSTFRATDAAYHPRARPLFDQLRRAAVSIETHIVEGYALDTTPQFKKHLRIARGSAAESECLLRTIAELEYLDRQIVSKLHGHLDLALKTLRGLLRNQNWPGKR